MAPTEGGHFAARSGDTANHDAQNPLSNRSGRKPYDWLEDSSYSQNSTFSSDELLSLTSEGLEQLQQHPGYSSQFARVAPESTGPAQRTDHQLQRLSQHAPQRIVLPNRRRRTGTIIGLIVGIILIAITAVCCYLFVFPKIVGYDFYAATTSDNDIDQEIGASITLLAKSDEMVVPMDNLVQAPIDASSTKEIDEVLGRKEEALAALTQAQEHIDRAGGTAHPTEEQRKVIQHVLSAIQARQQMIESGSHILAADKAIAASQADLVQSYKLMVDADEHARKALEASNEYAEARNKAAEEARSTGEITTSKEDLQAKADEATDNSKKALEAIKHASELVAEVHKKYPEPEVLAIKEYLDERVKAMTLSSEADQLVSDGKLEEAQAKIEEYNKLDAHVTELSNKIADDPSQLLLSVYERLTKADLTTYTQAREKAAESDAVIRTHQGVRISPQGTKIDDTQKK